MKTVKLVLLAALIAIATPLLASESKESKAAMQKEAKISMKKARGIALKKVPGKVASSELEREGGKLIYSFDIKATGTTSGVTEVNVDAVTGEIVKVEQESASKEAAEKKLEAKETAKPPTKH